MVKSTDTELERIEEDKENGNKIEKGGKGSPNTSSEQPSEKGFNNHDEEPDHGLHLLLFILFKYYFMLSHFSLFLQIY